MRITEHPVLEFEHGPKVTFTFEGKEYEGYEGEPIPVKSKIVCKFFQVQSKSGSGFHGCSVKRTCLSVEIFAVLQAKIQPLAS